MPGEAAWPEGRRQARAADAAGTARPAQDVDYDSCLRQVAGGMPNSRLNARLKAASVS